MSTENPSEMVDALIERILPETVATRHYLHQHPELSGQEEETSRLVADQLRGLGLDEVRTDVGGHGVIGTLLGQQEGPTLALRADMDALPIQETSDLPYRSCRPGVMHACGHDGHTATLLGAAAVLTQLRAQIHGSVRFIFQPAEETVGGAVEMCADGAMGGVAAIVALHGWPFLDVGQIGVRSGPMMASADSFDITVRGKSGHAAYPHISIDPIVVGAQIVQAFQAIASREISPFDSVVVTLAQFHAGTAYNVIPDVAEIKGTVRCLSKEIRAEMPARLERIIAGICAASRASYTFDYRNGTPVVVNDPAMTELVADIGRDLLGPENVITLETPSMGAEDFAVYLQHAPGMMFRLGVGADVTALHTPTYNFGDAPLPYGIALFTHIALRYCGEVGNP